MVFAAWVTRGDPGAAAAELAGSRETGIRTVLSPASAVTKRRRGMDIGHQPFVQNVHAYDRLRPFSRTLTHVCARSNGQLCASGGRLSSERRDVRRRVRGCAGGGAEDGRIVGGSGLAVARQAVLPVASAAKEPTTPEDSGEWDDRFLTGYDKAFTAIQPSGEG
jgi:hypothetical protein